MATDRKNDFVPGPNATNPEEANDKPRTGIYSAQMNIVFQDQTIMRCRHRPEERFRIIPLRGTRTTRTG